MFKSFLILVGFFTLLSNRVFGAEEGMPQLNPEYWVSQIFWVVLVFGSLYVFLWRIILPKINVNLENRKSQILADLNNAQKFKDQSEKKILDYNKILFEARQEANKIMNSARKKINRDIENKKKEFDLEIEKEIKNAEKEIKSLQLSSINDINKIAIEISSELAKKLVKSEINLSSVSAIVEEISKKEISNNI